MKDPTIVPARTGDVLWFLDTLMEVKVSAAATAGSLAVFEQLAPPGSATPMHRHDATDEYFYVLAGEVSFHGPGGAQHCGAGTFVAVPRGIVHGFRITSEEPARLLVMSLPATFERFVRAVSVPAASATLPPAGPPPGPDALERLAAVGAQHDVVLVGPPPPAT
jgi:quercetin dioxygenase-like cupin family protein